MDLIRNKKTKYLRQHLTKANCNFYGNKALCPIQLLPTIVNLFLDNKNVLYPALVKKNYFCPHFYHSVT